MFNYKLRSKSSKVAISGLFPVPHASEHRNRRIVQMNVLLKSWCRREGFRFLDHWDHFWGRWDLYKRDSLNLNQKGINILVGCFASAVGNLN